MVMIHIGRSGSSVLSGLMRQHPRVFWDGEIYQKHLNAHGFALGNSVGLNADALPDLDLAAMLRRSGPLIYGFEVKPFHLDLFEISHGDFARSLAPAGVSHVVVLERRNHLAKIVSSVRAQGDGIYHLPADGRAAVQRAPAELGSGISIDYTTGSLLEYLNRYASSFASIRSALSETDLPLLELTYEDHVEADPGIAYSKLCRHLNIPQRKPSVMLKRPTADSLASAIEDEDRVRQQLRGTEFEWMLP